MTDPEPSTGAASIPWWGPVCGLAAAVGYTAANTSLRAASEVDPFWVSSVKALPTALATAPAMLLFVSAGRARDIGRNSLAWLFAGVLVGQFLGNVGFQFALSTIGLALSVPLALGSMIVGGALLGRWMLDEPVTRRTIGAIVVLVLAVTVLSLGSGSVRIRPGISAGWIAAGVTCAITSGAAYGFLGASLRMVLRRGVPVTVTMFVSGSLGTSLLLAVTVSRIGWEGIAATEPSNIAAMVSAGVCNAAAFYALSRSLQVIPVVAVNLLNATQATMAAIAGWLVFSEPVTLSLLAGITLTVLGLTILGTAHRPTRKPRPVPAIDGAA